MAIEMYKNLSVGKKITITILTIGLLSCSAIAVTISSLIKTGNSSSIIANESIPAIKITNQIIKTIIKIRNQELNLLINTDDTTKKNDYARNLLDLHKELDEKILEYKSLPAREGDEDETLSNNMLSIWNEYKKTNNLFLDLYHKNDYAAAKKLFDNEITPNHHSLEKSLITLENEEDRYTTFIDLKIKSTISSTLKLTILTLVVFIVFSIGMTILLTRNISIPLALITTQAKLIASGNLSRSELCEYTESKKINHDEIGSLALSIRTMKENIHTLVVDIATSLSQLTSTIEQVNTIASMSSQKMTAQQSALNQLATAMTKMQSTVFDVSQNTSFAASAANTAANSSSSSSQIVNETISSIDNVFKEIEKAGEVVKLFEQDSNNIGLVLDVIRNIADQTNLLALNAAIEAARAGEQGRGFAVVADEVRALAQKTQDSTAEINKIIETLQHRAAKAGFVMSSSCQKVKECVSLAKTTGESINDVNLKISEISDMSIQIASATEEQNSVINELNRNIVNTNEVANEISLGANQTAQACQRINVMALGLQKIVNKFTF